MSILKNEKKRCARKIFINVGLCIFNHLFSITMYIGIRKMRTTKLAYECAGEGSELK
jgi:hypothetical protein